MSKTDLRDLTLDELKLAVEELGEKPFRAKQIFSWLHQKGAESFEEFKNIPQALREKIGEKYYISKLDIVEKLVSKDGTVKYLFDIGDGILIESVLMKYSYGCALCISTQAGCRMGCKFCASTLDGLERNLSASEILNQVYTIKKDSGENIHSIVLMGSGEPLDNFENVVKFLYIINHPEGMGLGMRHITLSTCGLTEKIEELSKLKLQLTLAISLHAPNDDIRKKTMPVANKYPLESIVKAAVNYSKATGRRVTYEYALIKGVNDSKENALELSARLKGTLCHVNLIPVNDVKENDFIRAEERNIQEFASVLTQKGIETTVRRKLGSDINAACGQLRKKYKRC
ncbi:MAG: 23S rRNA (adenine(2503)-C(2))-methyltransferase RlmN [Firmicutes bacterium]|nr:23S rRNA (adenine(2503)-C(2))-methyltransferase RlmN [Bacillota bacterium]